MSVVDLYTSEIHRSFRQFATWPVGTPITIGDYGVLENKWFVRHGNLTDDLDVEIDRQSRATGFEFEYKSAGVEEIRGGGDVQAGDVAPMTHISAILRFEKSDSIYFRSISSAYQFVDNYPRIQKNIFALFKREAWNGDWVFVHNLFVSDGTTIIVTSGANAEIKLSGRLGANEELDLADAKAQLKVASQRGVAARFICRENWVPLFGLSKIRPRNRLLALLGRREKIVSPLLSAARNSMQVRIPGEKLSGMEPAVSPIAAKNLGLSIEDAYQIVELD